MKVFLLGWRVLDIEGDTVKLVSAGIPLTYYNKQQSGQLGTHVIMDLINKFLNTTYSASGFTGTISENFTNQYTESVRSLQKEDIDNLAKTTLETGTDIRTLGSLIYTGGSYYLATMHPLDTRKIFIWCVHARTSYTTSHGNEGIYLGWGAVNSANGYYTHGYGTVAPLSCESYSLDLEKQTCGIRPVVTLYSDVKTTGRTDDGTWILTKEI